ncbi:hypothetical protein XM38_012490 [Halomicronema hongdechloris C2206]|uniref:Uncharacterized protein n=1 Tax=Halomicronema hongdechloris C2206 TaxID=1641165 RepID=A0A1Z3HJ23_9CYAN|nr:hypothetical protein [Halomicronema hongdechloris]ASC70312.1 hypothetical protein XM38_012490 [Halomicronema hongdechloris C2206]
MLGESELRDLVIICKAALVGGQDSLSDLFSLLGYLTQEDKRQFWQWLKTNDELLVTRLKRAKQRLEANPPQPQPQSWYSDRLKRARGM